jgi:hypothetical protein
VRRLTLAIVVGLLTVSASGLIGLVLNEPCTTYESGGGVDAACAPTCPTCTCCAQGVEPVAFAVQDTPDVPITDFPDLLKSLPRTAPRDILHVPKRRAA